MFEEEPHVAHELVRPDLVEDKDVCHFGQRRKLEACPNARLGTAGDEEFDPFDLMHEPTKDGKDCRRGFLVFAFVQRVDHDYRRNAGFCKGLSYQLAHLTIQGVVDDLWVRLDQRNEYRSKFSIRASELNRKGGEDQLEVSPVFEVSRAEERGSEPSVRKSPLRDRLRDGALSCSSEPVQPVDRGPVKVACPELNLVQNGAAGSLEAPVTVTVSILSLRRMAETVEENRFSCKDITLGDRH